jgi:hypothetical protein
LVVNNKKKLIIKQQNEEPRRTNKTIKKLKDIKNNAIIKENAV